MGCCKSIQFKKIEEVPDSYREIKMIQFTEPDELVKMKSVEPIQSSYLRGKLSE